MKLAGGRKKVVEGKFGICEREDEEFAPRKIAGVRTENGSADKARGFDGPSG